MASLLSILSAFVWEASFRTDLKVHITAACAPCQHDVHWWLWLVVAGAAFVLGVYCGYRFCQRKAVTGRPVVRAVATPAALTFAGDEIEAVPPSSPEVSTVVAEQTTTVVRSTRRAAAVRAT